MLKSLSPFILLFLIGVMSFRFLFFISYIKAQKKDFRQQLISSTTNQVVEVKFSSNDIYVNKNGFEWKEKNKELVINGQYHEVVSVIKVKDHFIVKIIEDKAENKLFQNFFCANKDIQHNYLDLVKVLLNFNYLNDPHERQIHSFYIYVVQKPIADWVFSDSQFSLKQIKPPQFA